MKVLIVWGSKMGGTEGIAEILGEELQRAGHEVTLSPAIVAPPPGNFTAVIVGGALYVNRWHPEAHRFVCRYLEELRGRPVWMFSSGPLDDSAKDGGLPPSPQVATLMDRVGALGHATFGGRLPPDAKGLVAAAMARTRSGDWRDPARVRAWAGELARLLPAARPRPAIDPPGRRLPRLVAHGTLGWAAWVALSSGLGGTGTAGEALAMIAVPLVFAALAHHYFRRGGTRNPLPTALALGAVAAVLKLGTAAVLFTSPAPSSLDLALHVIAFWLPLLLVVLSTWAVGAVMLSLPSPRPPAPARA